MILQKSKKRPLTRTQSSSVARRTRTIRRPLLK